ncbi:unnamed protein product [Didymodactylos carnosus]|uniref:C2H2-type domain-containing protein n=1 Tax=Didymodactylos carnosus TaxID=1234261 RepID=A0A813XAH5_9BILA|nr:unnamed protein product [Didymodactylos carnosus]CAF0867745.1 unnamed protein product [Didymodactylos carnosus]CAF3514377.1 unnamed protein product [Didymodactylos carnosus]CAF3655206.1 unnamed protein product [Didymodactylos carnosus]
MDVHANENDAQPAENEINGQQTDLPVQQRSRRKPAFSHQIISQAPRQHSHVRQHQNVDSSSDRLWERLSSDDVNQNCNTNTAEMDYNNGHRSENYIEINDPQNGGVNHAMRFERLYACRACSYVTSNPRVLLHHRRDHHSEDLLIYECTLCQYASEYNGKVERHLTTWHKLDKNECKTAVRKCRENDGNVCFQVPDHTASNADFPTLGYMEESSTDNNNLQQYNSGQITSTTNGNTSKLLISSVTDEKKQINNIHDLFPLSLPAQLSGSSSISTANGSSKRKPNVLHSILSQQRPIAPKANNNSFSQNHADIIKGTPPSSYAQSAQFSAPSRSFSTSIKLPSQSVRSQSSPVPKFITDQLSPTSFSFSPSSTSFTMRQQEHRKNFLCTLCNLTYKNFHDCTAHIRKKHEITHAQAGRYVKKLQSDNISTSSSLNNDNNNSNIHHTDNNREHHMNSLPRLSLPQFSSQPPPLINGSSTRSPFPSQSLQLQQQQQSGVNNKTFRCNYCSYSSGWSKDIQKHQRRKHPSLPPHIIKNEITTDQSPLLLLSKRDEPLSNTRSSPPYSGLWSDASVLNEIQDDNDIDDDDLEAMDLNGDFLTVPEDEQIIDDEDEALWKFQQVSDFQSPSSENNNLSSNSYDTSSSSLAKRFKKFRCPHCDHSAPTLTKLKLHVSTHINIKPYMCSLCGWRANLRWYIQCHAKKRHPNMTFEVLQLSNEEAEQTIDAYMRERGLDSKLFGGHDSKRRFQCSVCPFRSNHPKFVDQHIQSNHPNKAYAKMIISKKKLRKPITTFGQLNGTRQNGSISSRNENIDETLQKFMIHVPRKSTDQLKSEHSPVPTQPLLFSQRSEHCLPNPQTNAAIFINSDGDYVNNETYDDNNNSSLCNLNSTALSPNASSLSKHQNDYLTKPLYTRTNLQPDGTITLPDESKIVYNNFSLHSNFNPNRLFYCAICYRGYRWRYDVKRHHKALHGDPEGEILEYCAQLDALIPSSSASTASTTAQHTAAAMQVMQVLRNFDGESIGDGNGGMEQKYMLGGNDDFKLNEKSSAISQQQEDGEVDISIIDDVSNREKRLMSRNQRDGDPIPLGDTTNNPAFPAHYFNHLPSPLQQQEQKAQQPRLLGSSRHHLSNVKVAIPSTGAFKQRITYGFKPFKCPYCFYRTNWRTDALRHIRARHKIEPEHDGYYELSTEEAERTFEDYENTFGFVVSKKVLGRYTEFRHMEWYDLQKMIYDQIKDKHGYEQIILERLRPPDYPPLPPSQMTLTTMQATMAQSKSFRQRPSIVAKNVVNSGTVGRSANRSVSIKQQQQFVPLRHKRLFTCNECGYNSSKILELEKHTCTELTNVTSRINQQHIKLHQSVKHSHGYYCSHCGYNSHSRSIILLHIIKKHSLTSVARIKPFKLAKDAEFQITQTTIIDKEEKSQQQQELSSNEKLYNCLNCPYISMSLLEFTQHQQFHANNSTFQCQYCTFSSPSQLYCRQHELLHLATTKNEYNQLFHLKSSGKLSTPTEKSFQHPYFPSAKLKRIGNSRLLILRNGMYCFLFSAISEIIKNTIEKRQKRKCPFCTNYSSIVPSDVVEHIQNIHFNDDSSSIKTDLFCGYDAIRDILTTFGTDAQSSDDSEEQPQDGSDENSEMDDNDNQQQQDKNYRESVADEKEEKNFLQIPDKVQYEVIHSDASNDGTDNSVNQTIMFS